MVCKNQNAPYLIASTSGYTDATRLEYMEHRFKTDSTGTPRITIDTHAGEALVAYNRNVASASSNEKLYVLEIY